MYVFNGIVLNIFPDIYIYIYGHDQRVDASYSIIVLQTKP